jgi:hypothetical protein
MIHLGWRRDLALDLELPFCIDLEPFGFVHTPTSLYSPGSKTRQCIFFKQAIRNGFSNRDSCLTPSNQY